jgi:hypothetical protein
MAVLNDILGISGETQTDSDTDGDWDKYEAGQVIEFFLRVDGEERIQAVATDPSDQIRDVKDLLVNKLGFKVSVDSLRLTYRGKPLTEDGATIEDYGIQPRSTVDVRLKEAFLLGAGPKKVIKRHEKITLVRTAVSTKCQQAGSSAPQINDLWDRSTTAYNKWMEVRMGKHERTFFKRSRPW